jgi:hypothetical protein
MCSIKKIQISIVLILGATLGFSQDLIVKKDSTKIFCKITKEDSLTIFYKSIRDKQHLEQSILKTDVIKYFNSASIAKDAKTRIDTAQRIWQAKTLKKGFYKSAIEYVTNSPSIVKDFLVFQRNAADLVFQHGGDYSFKLIAGQGPALDETEIYGFCDGDYVYLNYDHPKGYSKIEHLGAYSYFTYTYHGTGVIALLPDQLVIIDEDGKPHEASPNYIKKILALKAPDLLKVYKQEEDPRAKREEYLRELNNYLKTKK